MTNRERYQRAFQALQTSATFETEALDMKRANNNFSLSRRAAVTILAAILLLGSLTAAFAADLGGIRRAVTLWIGGASREAVVEAVRDGDVDMGVEADDVETGQYRVSWEDDDGQVHEMMGGGVALEADGSERPITMDEFLEEIDSPALEARDGRDVLTWRDQALDITDELAQGEYRAVLTHGEESVEVVVTPDGDGGFNLAVSPAGEAPEGE